MKTIPAADVCTIGRDITITLRKRGADAYSKASYPQQFGVYSEIETTDTVLRFNLNNEIVYLRGRGRDWPHPQEWLKRTAGNDWIYYSTGGYTGVVEAIGEYYLPNTPYPTNSLLGGRPFLLPVVQELTACWHSLIHEVAEQAAAAPADIRAFLAGALANSPDALENRAQALFAISGSRSTVLPPDCRHVDYDVIPLAVSEGCLYKCRFCSVKSDRPFRQKSEEEVDRQISALQGWFGQNMANTPSVFLGEHDALAARPGLIAGTISKACSAFDFQAANIKGGNVFLFGSVGSLLDAPDGLFADLGSLPCHIYLNIGLESADQATLEVLGKPLRAAAVVAAFKRMQEINRRHATVEVTANFIMDENLPAGHYPAFLALVREGLSRVSPKGCIYLSPLRVGRPSRAMVMDFHRLKILSRLPTFLYIIQRL